MKGILEVAATLAICLAGCSRGASPGRGTADGRAEAPGSFSGDDYLPPGAIGYIALEPRTLLAAPAVAPLKQRLLANVPNSCRTMLASLDRVLFAVYPKRSAAALLRGGPPATGAFAPGRASLATAASLTLLAQIVTVPPGPNLMPPGANLMPPAEPRMEDPFGGFVAVLVGASLDTVNACLDETSRAAGVSVTVDNRDGREVRLGGGEHDLAVFSATAAVQVAASPALLEAALAASPARPSLAGSPLLQALTHVPMAPMLAAFDGKEVGGAGGAMFKMLLTGGNPDVTVQHVVVSISATTALSVVVVASLPDEAAAGKVESGLRALVDRVRTQPPDGPSLLATTLGRVVISRQGTEVSAHVDVPGDLMTQLLP